MCYKFIVTSAIRAWGKAMTLYSIALVVHIVGTVLLLRRPKGEVA